MCPDTVPMGLPRELRYVGSVGGQVLEVVVVVVVVVVVLVEPSMKGPRSRAVPRATLLTSTVTPKGETVVSAPVRAA